jgi:hypothetical protein
MFGRGDRLGKMGKTNTFVSFAFATFGMTLDSQYGDLLATGTVGPKNPAGTGSIILEVALPYFQSELPGKIINLVSL